MSRAKSFLAYSDCRTLLDEALASASGIKVKLSFDDEGRRAAISLTHKLNACRAQSRRESTKIYGADDPQFGVSPYDELLIRKVAEFCAPEAKYSTEHCVVIEKVSKITYITEEL